MKKILIAALFLGAIFNSNFTFAQTETSGREAVYRATHTKTTAIMGVGASKRMSAVNWKIVKEMSLAWVLTFPGCGLLGYLMAKLFMLVF